LYQFTPNLQGFLLPHTIHNIRLLLRLGIPVQKLNMALFGLTAKDWRDTNPDKKGNIRDYANVSQLVCLSNLENLNALFINDDMSQKERLEKLNKIAIDQMRILIDNKSVKRIGLEK